ncbi:MULTISPECIES: AMP-binding protein [unclassified Colwellia]|uniref:AMP-binding protein n=1 Tax=unclassified Colwellia TaxID=196834 RepID=UPI0015F4AA25|nr:MULTISPECIES: AMP-binding protein [unclassified Colwellia]MBA6350827.1 AMP-binding protein [Colwellia sp. BRX9-1]MBA6354442.1 AMP-binding protein [Colwellia sp. BRX8-3]MBA6358291.1 AMP-binding protein [Colwellia sp. BRX8-6]MBA6365956.1 AMP-binding protein [Colwellia sp. BRX8-5]MBA6374081.1 AMP-binding protein [Colwellia sp. BRX8-2]
MTKPWLINYPKNVEQQVDLNRYASLLELFHQTTTKYKPQTAFSNFGAELSFEQVDELSRDFAAFLQNKLNITKGKRVALMCPNTLAFPIAMWGIIRVGGVQVNVNPMYTARELKHQLNDAQVDTIIIFSPSTKMLADIIDTTDIKHVITVNLDDLVNKSLPCQPVDQRLTTTIRFTDALIQGQNLALVEPTLCQADLLFLQYTGGTTGLSKGAMLSHGNLIANILQFEEFAKNHIHYGNDVVITAIPMYHIFALMANTLSYFYFGAKNVLVTNPRDMASFVDIWKNTDATMFTGVNTLFNGLLHTPGFDQVDFSALKLSLGGGAAVQQAVADKWQQVTGARLHEGYGLSETSPVLSLNFGTVIDNETVYIPGIGVPLPNTDISIRDDDGNIVSQGESGELCAKGPQVMQGYWNNAQASDECMTQDGYFKTGDVGILDDKGFFHIVDRKKDMINVSGFNVYPNEIEAEVAKMAGILESACIGVDDDKTGEAVKLFIVKEDENITEQDVINFCRQGLTAYKTPKHVTFINEIPKSSVGKLLRRELR